MPNNNCSNLINGRTGLQVTARTAGAAKTIEVEVDKPLGLTLGQKSGGGVVITVSLIVIGFYIFVFLAILLAHQIEIIG